MTPNFDPFLAVGAVLFVLGAIGFVTRRNLIVMMLSAELMLHGVSLTLLAFGQIHNRMEGQTFTVFVLTIAACEAGLALAIVLSLYQSKKSLDVNLWGELREEDLPARVLSAEEEDQAAFEPAPLVFPGLSPAGRVPGIDMDAPLDGQLIPRATKNDGKRFTYGEPEEVELTTKP
jgi:NADH-quinone oxidoreductase subunit K